MELKKDISTRQDVRHLVDTFYDIIKIDEMLGPIFNHMIDEDKWELHLEKLTDFWESQLFTIPKFKGNPVRAHRNVDAIFEYKIDQTHFAKWLQLWFATVNALFQGEKAEFAKQRARNMATGQFLKMWEARPEQLHKH